MTECAYRYWLHSLPGVGDRTIEKLLKHFGSAGKVYEAGEEEVQKLLSRRGHGDLKQYFRTWDIQEKYRTLTERGIRLVTWDEEAYPARLKQLAHPPFALYCMGNLPGNEVPAAAVVGARECSEYGRFAADAFAGRLAQGGVNVISGMARGIDGIAQRAALDAGGKTYAVLGSGVDVCYPASNRALYERILETGGGILSTFPPGTEPLKKNFPMRNRIVAGLSDLLLVVEARLKSGTWITVDMALEQGKSVYAVPGRLTDRLSDGCNFLIRQGAGIALTPEDILAELSVLQNRQGTERSTLKEGKKPDAEGQTAGTEDRIWNLLDEYPRSADEILEALRRAQIPMELPELMNVLIGLCLENRAKQTGSGYFSKIRTDHCFP